MRKHVARFCGSCPHYDAFGDACAYQGPGCERLKPQNTPKPPDVEPLDSSCRGCAYLDARTGDCHFPGLGCVLWKKRKEG